MSLSSFFGRGPSATDVALTSIAAGIADLQMRAARMELALSQITAMLKTLATQEHVNAMANKLNFDNLAAAVAKLEDAEEGAIKVLADVAANNLALSQQLKDALAANDPAAAAEAQQAIEAAATKLQADAAKLAAAVVANTPAAA